MYKKKSWTWFTPRGASKKTFSEDKTEKSCAGNVLNSYNFYMTNLEVNINTAEEVVLYHSLKSKIEKERVVALLVELWAVRKHTNEEQFKVPKSTRQRAKERAVWGNFLHIGTVLLLFECGRISKYVWRFCSTWKTQYRNLIISRSYSQISNLLQTTMKLEEKPGLEFSLHNLQCLLCPLFSLT
jgi:hypothetical protein